MIEHRMVDEGRNLERSTAVGTRPSAADSSVHSATRTCAERWQA